MGTTESKNTVVDIVETTYRILTYNVEWGFLTVPSDVTSDSCGHPIPHTDIAQKTHLTLISKNIGTVNPDICFLQEMGSLQATTFIATELKSLFNLDYYPYYSNGNNSGNQGVGILIKSNINDKIDLIETNQFSTFDAEKLKTGVELTAKRSGSKNIQKLVSDSNCNSSDKIFEIMSEYKSSKELSGLGIFMNALFDSCETKDGK